VVDAVVLAGRRNAGRLASVSDVAWEALIPVAGRPMVQWVIEALEGSESVSRILLVGAPEVQSAVRGKKVSAVTPGVDLLTSLSRGIRASNRSCPVLVVTGDLPLLTPEAVEDFLDQCSETSAEFYYPIISKQLNEAKYPGMRRTYGRVRDGTFTGGNIVLVEPAAFYRCYDRIAAFVRHRKNPLRQASLLGWTFTVRLLAGTLTVEQVERRVREIFGVRAVAVWARYPEIAVDVDKPSDLQLVNSVLSGRFPSAGAQGCAKV